MNTNEYQCYDPNFDDDLNFYSGYDEPDPYEEKIETIEDEMKLDYDKPDSIVTVNNLTIRNYHRDCKAFCFKYNEFRDFRYKYRVLQLHSENITFLQVYSKAKGKFILVMTFLHDILHVVNDEGLMYSEAVPEHIAKSLI